LKGGAQEEKKDWGRKVLTDTSHEILWNLKKGGVYCIEAVKLSPSNGLGSNGKRLYFNKSNEFSTGISGVIVGRLPVNIFMTKK